MKKFFTTKYTVLLRIVLVMLAPMLEACQKDKANNQPVEFKPLLHLNECKADIGGAENSDNFFVINSQEELNQHILINDGDQSTCIQLSEELQVDFKKWTILIGKKRLTHIEGELIKQSVLNLDNDLIYKVTIKNGGYAAIGQFRFGVIIPKISNDTNVKFDVVVE